MKNLLLFAVAAMMATSCAKESISEPIDNDEAALSATHITISDSAETFDENDRLDMSATENGAATRASFYNITRYSSHETAGMDGNVAYLFDNNANKWWHTKYVNVPNGFRGIPAFVEFNIMGGKNCLITGMCLRHVPIASIGRPSKMMFEYRDNSGRWNVVPGMEQSGVIQRPSDKFSIPTNKINVDLMFSTPIIANQMRLTFTETAANVDHMYLEEISTYGMIL